VRKPALQIPNKGGKGRKTTWGENKGGIKNEARRDKKEGVKVSVGKNRSWWKYCEALHEITTDTASIKFWVCKKKGRGSRRTTPRTRRGNVMGQGGRKRRSGGTSPRTRRGKAGSHAPKEGWKV